MGAGIPAPINPRYMTLTKRDLVVRISSETGFTQQQIMEVIQKTLNYIGEALARGDKVELRNFGVFEVKVRRARVGRNPNAPTATVTIPQRSVVRFRPGKEMRAEGPEAPTQTAQPPGQDLRGPAAPWNVCPDFAISIPSRCPSRTCGAPTRAGTFSTSGAPRRAATGFANTTARRSSRWNSSPPRAAKKSSASSTTSATKANGRSSLRPEMTPTLARMVAAHERSYKKPIKWFALPQLFRYERQQKGRLREHFQFNADIIGESDAGGRRGIDRAAD